jgi:hypothetical protein
MVMLHDDDDTDDDTAIPQQRRTVEEGDETEVNEGKQQRTRLIIYEEAMHLLHHRFQS